MRVPITLLLLNFLALGLTYPQYQRKGTRPSQLESIGSKELKQQWYPYVDKCWPDVQDAYVRFLVYLQNAPRDALLAIGIKNQLKQIGNDHGLDLTTASGIKTFICKIQKDPEGTLLHPKEISTDKMIRKLRILEAFSLQVYSSVSLQILPLTGVYEKEALTKLSSLLDTMCLPALQKGIILQLAKIYTGEPKISIDHTKNVLVEEIIAKLRKLGTTYAYTNPTDVVQCPSLKGINEVKVWDKLSNLVSSLGLPVPCKEIIMQLASIYTGRVKESVYYPRQLSVESMISKLERLETFSTQAYSSDIVQHPLLTDTEENEALTKLSNLVDTMCVPTLQKEIIQQLAKITIGNGNKPFDYTRHLLVEEIIAKLRKLETTSAYIIPTDAIQCPTLTEINETKMQEQLSNLVSSMGLPVPCKEIIMQLSYTGGPERSFYQPRQQLHEVEMMISKLRALENIAIQAYTSDNIQVTSLTGKDKDEVLAGLSKLMNSINLPTLQKEIILQLVKIEEPLKPLDPKRQLLVEEVIAKLKKLETTVTYTNSDDVSQPLSLTPEEQKQILTKLLNIVDSIRLPIPCKEIIVQLVSVYMGKPDRLPYYHSQFPVEKMIAKLRALEAYPYSTDVFQHLSLTGVEEKGAWAKLYGIVDGITLPGPQKDVMLQVAKIFRDSNTAEEAAEHIRQVIAATGKDPAAFKLFDYLLHKADMEAVIMLADPLIKIIQAADQAGALDQLISRNLDFFSLL